MLNTYLSIFLKLMINIGFDILANANFQPFFIGVKVLKKIDKLFSFCLSNNFQANDGFKGWG